MQQTIEYLVSITERELKKIDEDLIIAENIVREDLQQIYLKYYPEVIEKNEEEFIKKYFDNLLVIKKAGLNSAKRKLLKIKREFGYNP
jgi:hypothetical protein